jgi:hypothetical protein
VTGDRPKPSPRYRLAGVASLGLAVTTIVLALQESPLALLAGLLAAASAFGLARSAKRGGLR